ncbi:MAG: ABC transporter substrate-binding protein [Bacteroidota bacterium]
MRAFVFKLFAGIFLLFLSACSGKDGLGVSGGAKSSKNTQKVVRIAEISLPATIFPHNITTSIEGLITSQIHEGLVKINPRDLTLLPGLAESWEIDEATKTITFHLRKGVKFQKSPVIPGSDTEITSKDVKFTFELLCTGRPGNVHFYTVCKDRVVGADAFYNATAADKNAELNGFRVIDDHTFSIRLLNSPNIFLQILSNPVAAIISKKAYEARKEASNVGAGAFILDEQHSTKTHFSLYKNPDYYAKDKDGKSLPYLDSLIIDIVTSTEEALELFQSGAVDFISSVPSNQLRQIVEDNIKSFKYPAEFILEQRPEMISYYYLFNTHSAPFNNLKLRQAVNYAIDRTKIVDRVLHGQAYGPAVYGVVPPTFDFYKINAIQGYDLNLDKAKKLLKEAGYADGSNLPEVRLIVNSGNTRNNTVAAEIQRQLKNNLNINVTFESLPNAEKYTLQLKGKGDLFREGWVADYPSPESFLSVFYGEYVTSDTAHESYPNTMRYQNKNYDKYYELGRDATSREMAMGYFLKAEQILLNDAPLIPLWYESNCRLIKTRLKNFHSNPLRYLDFTKVDVALN